MVLGSSGIRLEELDAGTKHEGREAASKGAAYRHWTERLLRRLIHDVIGHIRCTGMMVMFCPDHATLKALVLTLNPPTRKRVSCAGVHFQGLRLIEAPTNHALDCKFIIHFLLDPTLG